MADLEAQLAEQIAAAAAAKRPLRLVGGATKTALLGRAIEGEVLAVGGHSGIVSYQPTELVLTARAGTPLTEIEAALAEKGQTLSFEPPHFGAGATLGGTLACNLSGPARPWGGSIRDMVLGVRLINGQGERLRFGGQVMKNVAGFDVSRLQAGALGTLGVITEVSLKVLPRPQATITLVEESREVDAIQTMNRLAGRPWPITGAAWFDHRVHLRLAGEPEAVQAARRDLGAMAEGDESFWTELREQRLDFFQGAAPLWRLSVGSTTAPLEKGQMTLIDWGGAQRWLRGGEAAHRQDQAAKAGGHASLFRGGDRTGEVAHPLPPALMAIHRRLKAALDPVGILNRGRLYGWL